MWLALSFDLTSLLLSHFNSLHLFPNPRKKVHLSLVCMQKIAVQGIVSYLIISS
jgi:hypothetical protein